MALVTSKSIQVKANSTDVSSAIDWSSIDVTLVLTKEVSTFKFNVRLKSGRYAPALGDQIDLYETDSSNTTSHLFGGTITELEPIVEGGIQLVAQVTATDWSFTMNGKLVVKSYTAMDPADIIADIVSNYCPAGFDTTTYVQRAGYTIPTIKFNYEQVTKAIQSLASQIGWEWYVDADKKVHFFLAENNSAPFPIDDTTGGIEWGSLDIDTNLTNLKNSVYVIGGVYQKTFNVSNEVDVFNGDGVTLSFSLAYAYTDSSIVVIVGGVTKTVGLANQVTDPTSFDCIYNQSTRSVTFNAAPAAKIEVNGVAQIPIVAHAIDDASIATYGEFQSAIFDSQIKSITEAQMRAQAEILLYGHAVYDVKFYTITPGLRIGQNILLNSAKFGISNYPLVIKRIEGIGNTSSEIRYQVECVGSDQVTFVDLMSTILQQENANIQVDNTTLEVLLTITETLTDTDSLAAPTAATTGQYQYGSTAGQAGYWNLATWG